MMFNPNPTEKNDKSTKGDCVIRALAIASDRTWIEAYDILADNARKTYNLPNDCINYTQVFENILGYKPKSVKVEKGKKRLNVLEFCKKHHKGRYILRVAHHLTAVVDGVCYDTWNTAERCVYRYWEVKI